MYQSCHAPQYLALFGSVLRCLASPLVGSIRNQGLDESPMALLCLHLLSEPVTQAWAVQPPGQRNTWQTKRPDPSAAISHGYASRSTQTKTIGHGVSHYPSQSLIRGSIFRRRSHSRRIGTQPPSRKTNRSLRRQSSPAKNPAFFFYARPLLKDCWKHFSISAHL